MVGKEVTYTGYEVGKYWKDYRFSWWDGDVLREYYVGSPDLEVIKPIEDEQR